MSAFIQFPSGSGQGIQSYATFSALPTGQPDGTVAIVLDTYILYAFEAGGSIWVAVGGPGSVLSIGTFDAQPAVAAGLQIVADQLYAQSADATHPGMVNTGAQTLAGAKTFSTAPILSSLTASLPLQLDASKNVTSAAIDLSGAQATGTLAAGRFPALLGDVTTSAGSLTTSLVATSNTTLTSLANLATVGTISTGVWHGTAVGAQYGGTGANSSGSTGIAHVSAGAWTFSAVDLSGADATGTLAAGRFPALTGDMTTSAGSLATTAAATQNNITSIPNLATVGTIGTGTWHATAIGAQYGGTGIDTHLFTGYPSISSGTWSVASASSTFTSLFETVATTLGDLVYGGASGAPTRLAGDTSNTRKFLREQSSGSVATAPVWDTLVSGDLPTITLTSDVTGSASGGSVATTVAKIQGTTVSGTTGTTNVVFSASPTLTGTVALAALNAGGTVNIATLTASQAVVTDASKNLTSLGYGSTNTNSTLVERDSSGNFAAGTLTLVGASFSGLTASQAVVTDGSKNLASLAYAATATASALAQRDANTNLSTGNFIEGYRSQVTAGSTTTLTVSDVFQQYFTGTLTQTCQMPVTSTLVTGQAWQIVNLSTGAVTITSSGSNTIQVLPATSCALVTCISTSGSTASSWSAIVSSIVGGASGPTVQRFTSGTSQTYTTPTNPAPLYIKVKIVGGGGGGAGSGTSNGTAATDGGASSFSGSGITLTANGGVHGTRGGQGGVGGTASSSGAVSIAAVGGATGSGAQAQNSSVTTATPSVLCGGSGGNSVFSGAGGGDGTSGGGQSATTNSGSGGGGGAATAVNNSNAGAGGGAGAYVEAIIVSPASSYTYSVGTAGSAGGAGGSGFAGGAGAAGIVIVEEYYPQFATGSGNYTVDTFSGDGSTTAFTLSAAPGSINNTQVYISGVYQQKATYSVAGTTITFTTAPPSGTSNIQVVTGLAMAIGTPSDGTVTYAKTASSLWVVPTIQTFASTGTQTGWLFTCSSANATVGAVYKETVSGNSFTVLYTISGATTLACSGTGITSSTTLTKQSGTGDGTITFTTKVALATYTLPTSPRTPLYIKYRMVGGGGGGGGSGTTGFGSGTNGGQTFFGGSIANGGVGGNISQSVTPSGGTVSFVLGTQLVALQGGSGSGFGEQSVANVGMPGGGGAASPFGGAGGGGCAASTPIVGGTAIANSGSGGGGGGAGNTSGSDSGQGGGAGGYIEGLVSSPAATYAYVIGAQGGAGGAGSNGVGGGAGATGYIEVTEYYQ